MKTVAIDPGHGGKDPGSINVEGGKEAVFAWQLADQLGKTLRANWQVQVVYTHQGADSSVTQGTQSEELQARAEVANKAEADLMVSLHHDAAGDPKARGASLWIWTDKLTPEGGLVWLPALEMGRQNHKDPTSFRVANLMLPHLKAALATFKVPWRGHIMCANFGVLRDCRGPAVLFEAFFGTNPEDHAASEHPDFIPRIAFALAQGIAEALRLPEQVKTPPNAFTVLVDGVEVSCNAHLVGAKVECYVRELAEALGGRVGVDMEGRIINISSGHTPKR